MSSGDSYQVMADFAGQLTDSRLQAPLFRALDKRGPFLAFRDVSDNAGDYRQQWFASNTSDTWIGSTCSCWSRISPR